jgi:hypothetical protein
MAFEIKDWKDDPDPTTPLSAAALEDLESRLSTYTDEQVATSVDTSLIAAKGDLLVGTGIGALANLGAGGNGQVLTADSAQATGIKWSDPTGGGGSVLAGGGLTLTGSTLDVGAGLGISIATDTVAIDTAVIPRLGSTNSFTDANTFTKAGNDAVIVRSGNSAANAQQSLGRTASEALLAVSGGTNQFLNIDAAGDLVIKLADNTKTIRFGLGTTQRFNITNTGLNSTVPLDVGSNKITSLASGVASNDAVSVSQVILKSFIDAKGDLIVGTADDIPARLPVGTTGQILTVDLTQTNGVKWASPAAGVTAGVGITITSGTVSVDGSTVPLLSASSNTFAGSTVLAGGLALSTNRITGVGDPTGTQDAATKNYVDTRTKTWREVHSFAIDTPAVKIYPGFAVALATGQSASIKKVRAVTDAGTATVSVRKNGSNTTNFASISVSSTAATTTGTEALAEDNLIDLNVTAMSGAGRLTVTVVLEHTL